MKYLLFSDIHGDLEKCEELVKKAEKVDIVLGAGDFGSFRKGIEEPIAILSRIEKPSLLVHGNHETFDELKSACRNWKSAHVLHGTSVVINGITFFGLGGATPVTPFIPWSVDVSEEDAAELLKACPRNAVLISHSPPYKCLDAISPPKKHIGSKSIKAFIEDKDPLFVVCGHIHEAWNQKDAVGKVPVINAGPFGLIFEI
ncbi:MAG: serine/threonine protein phosphatase [Desulfobacteraceae bacterium]|nr:serine/threonine protein phosphatase [Desulfobacteraceae bacterium]MBU4053351.1 metallophosphoesterase family protein [Pseudomonadota bacterium]